MLLNESFFGSLSKLVSFDSSLSESKENMPFGEGVYNALNYFLSLAKEMGFNTINYNNYAGEVFFGEGQEVGIIGHLDIVPPGYGWKTNPFELTEKNGVFYGRGLCDDKAPILLCLYALKEIKDSGIKFNKKIRLFVGCNEETGWKDLEYLNSKTKMPDFGFSPDGNFPLCHAEKGIYIAEFKLNNLKNFTIIDSGSAINAVCAFASARVNTTLFDTISPSQFESLLKKHNLTLNEDIVESVGKSAHGSAPEEGVNAIKFLFDLFSDCGEDVEHIKNCLFYDKFYVNKTTTEQGNVTFSPNLISQKQNVICVKCDCRLPYPLTVSVLEEAFNKFNAPYTIQEKHPTFYAPKDGWLVKNLISAYQEIMGDKNAQPTYSSGSTFARAFKEGCSFGPEMKGFGGAHIANEYATKEGLETAYKIYKKAIENIIK